MQYVCRVIGVTALLIAGGLVTIGALGFGKVADAVAASAASQSGSLDAVKLAFKGDFIGAGEAALRSNDSAAIKLVELIYLRDKPNAAGYSRIMSFLEVAPNWPLSESLLKRAERSLYVNREPSEIILTHFKGRRPSTAQGSLAYARALIETGQKASAIEHIKDAYYNTDISAELETQITSEFGGLITADDRKIRMWRLVYALDADSTLRVAKQLPADYLVAAGVARDLLRLKPGADKQYAQLSVSMQREFAMKFALVRFYRSNKNIDAARAILANIPASQGGMGDAEAWWGERRIIARQSVGKSSSESVSVAYQIANAHGLSRGDKAAEAEFLAGWIALRYLRDPGKARKHFARLIELAETRTDKARAGYWMGRTLDALEQKGGAKAFYREAARYTTVYYGQLAREKIGLGRVDKVPAPEAC